jgi:hypothetical protein
MQLISCQVTVRALCVGINKVTPLHLGLPKVNDPRTPSLAFTPKRHSQLAQALSTGDQITRIRVQHQLHLQMRQLVVVEEVRGATNENGQFDEDHVEYTLKADNSNALREPFQPWRKLLRSHIVGP